MILHLEKEIADAWAGDDPFVRAQQQQGKIFREKEGRRTLRFALNGKNYFLKLHQGIGWYEIVKNLLQLRLPVINASNEWLAIKKLQQLNLDTMTMVGYGRRGINPAKQVSFLITDELRDKISASTICETWAKHPPTFQFKQVLIRRFAETARRLHQNGINHRDFYLCHFYLERAVFDAPANRTIANPRLFVVDLHRAQIRKKTPQRWMVKDLSGLYSSAREINVAITSRDLLRFIRVYGGKNWRELNFRERLFWQKVMRRAMRT